ncbi:DUF5666 domain-containing protein [Photobacterium japonica]|uniref:DUF5666 domain-containing protein n=1 Tax=Photobacterium japonica TaxID=2910235 RepID=UPI003D0C6943
MKRYAMLPLFSLAMVGCGGGSSDGGETTSPSTAYSVEGTIERVTETGIVVNGKEYPVDAVNYQGLSESVSFLAGKENMMVRLGSDNSRRGGMQVELEPTFTGQIMFAPPTPEKPHRFLVNGVELEFDRLSKNIENGDWVMVSALPTANAGYKVLSVIEFNNEFGQLAEAEGRISELNENNGTFKIGHSLLVRFDVNKFDTLRNGMWVEVMGSFNDSEHDPELSAETITHEDYSHITHDGEIEGIVTWVAKNKKAFELNYRAQIKVNGATEFDDGNKNDLKPGAWVEVELRNNQNKLIAEEIEFEGRDDDNGDWDALEFEIEGYVGDYHYGNKTFTINDITIHTDARTEYEDGANFGNINQEYVEVEGMWIDGKRIARSIEIEDADD